MFSSLSKIQKISICTLFLLALLVFMIGSILFKLMENKNISIAIMVCGAVICVITSIVWIVFSKLVSVKKESSY